jgi:hypothetical protein
MPVAYHRAIKAPHASIGHRNLPVSDPSETAKNPFLVSFFLYNNLFKSFDVLKRKHLRGDDIVLKKMPALTKTFLDELRDDYRDYGNFIETGTYHGETIFAMEPFFQKLYTIEIKEDLYENVRQKYGGHKISFHLGDSSIVLMKLLPLVTGKSIFFLDGHWSAGDTGRGKKDCPLYDEIDVICAHHKDPAILIIDDVRLFGKGPTKGDEICDWEDINTKTILEKTFHRAIGAYFKPSPLNQNDRLIIHLKEIS